MELQEAKDSLLELIKEKDKIEAEIQALLDSVRVARAFSSYYSNMSRLFFIKMSFH